MNARSNRSDIPLPPFTDDGVLPVGDYALTLRELRTSSLATGQGVASSHWDSPWRRQLVDNLSVLVRQLWQVGITAIFIDGSFVEEKDHPNDIDGYFECDLKRLACGELQESLNRLDPHQVWTWDPASRERVPGFSKKQLPMWRQYRVELFPHWGQSSGILDPHGHELDFPAAFRLSRSGIPKGIVQIKPDS